MFSSLLDVPNVDEKLRLVEGECHRLLLKLPQIAHQLLWQAQGPARDIQLVSSVNMPKRRGLDTAEGQARMLHDLASIELQAMELGVRTLYEFCDSPLEFRSGLAEIVLGEAKHLRLCVDGIRELGFNWGHWPGHNTLWKAAHLEDSLIDRLLIVNCYLEGSGLDATDILLRSLTGVANRLPREIVKVIAREEVGHVEFGLTWYRELCRREGIDSQTDFGDRLTALSSKIPVRAARISVVPRKLAGFTDSEISFVTSFSQSLRGGKY